MTNSRAKGASAEREVFKLMGDFLGFKVERNLSQTRDGGYDSVVGDFAVEVKRQETLNIKTWWEQATQQAGRCDPPKMPMLIYRQSRQPWRVVVWNTDYFGVYGSIPDAIDFTPCTIELPFEEGCRMIKHSLMICSFRKATDSLVKVKS
jgi:hypothetical protein